MMDLFEYMEKTAIPSVDGRLYEGIAFDGCNYYFLMPCICKIIKTDQCYTHINCFETCREYNCLCYDFKECCFWAASPKCSNKIFKLNACMQEIDCITVCDGKESFGIITGISYCSCSCCCNSNCNCDCDSLLVAFTGGIAEVDKKSEKVVMRHKSRNQWITGVCCVSPYYIVSAIKEGKQYVTVFLSDDKPLHTQVVPCDYRIKNILYNPCIEDCKDYRFDILAVKNGCYPYLIQAKLNPCGFDFHPCQCNACICKECCEDIHCEHGDACADIVESIALIETALSHILNAEGEKLQKVLEVSCDVDEILCVNKEINKTIINATHLEHVLYAKLSAVMECCRPDCEPEEEL